MTRLEGVRAAACTGLIAAATAAPAIANPESAALRAKAANYTYNLDHDLALATFREAVAADPQDAGALRGLASSLWLSITFKRGNMTVDDYLGRPNKPNTNPLPPTGDAAAGFKDAVEQAIALARQRIAKNAGDADAHYQLGAAVGLRASYTATVEGSVTGAFARRARRTTRRRRSSSCSRRARMRASSSAPTATSSRRWRCRCAWSPMSPASAAARRRGSRRSRKRQPTAATTRPRRGSR
jgi:hypothetical protein